ncbi:hypothetical protein OQA88_253 [Cercophora sp. LCS_1]
MSSTKGSPEPAAGSSNERPGRALSEAGEVEDSPSPSPAPNESPDAAQNLTAKPTDDESPTQNPDAPPLPDEPLPGSEKEESSTDPSAPPLPDEPLPGSAPPLPAEPAPEPEDDGWECHWNPNTASYWFYNRFTAVWQQENPRVPDGTASAGAPAVTVPGTQDKSSISNPVSVSGGYNPAIHGDYDENAWYAQNARAVTEPSTSTAPTESEAEYASGGFFNRWTGQWQAPDQGVERHTDEAKSKRQMNAYFDVDAAANMHDGRSLKAERAGKKPSKAELKMFKEKRRAKKEEKRRAWLRD